MSDWQPARVVPAHLKNMDCPVVKLCRKIPVLIRPAYPSSSTIESYRRHGCDSQRFFAVKNNEQIEQARRDAGFMTDVVYIVCEHQILTD